MSKWWRPRSRRNIELLGRVLGWIDAQNAGRPCPEPALDGVSWFQGAWWQGDGDHLVTACAGTATLLLTGHTCQDILALPAAQLRARSAKALGLTRSEATLVFGPFTTRWTLAQAGMAIAEGRKITARALSAPLPPELAGTPGYDTRPPMALAPVIEHGELIGMVMVTR